MASFTSPFYNDEQKLFRWNWGAFVNPLGFGYAHRAYKTFLLAVPSIIPCVLAGFWLAEALPGIIPLISLPLLLAWNIACGAAGERMAWAVGIYEDGVAFRAAMDSWNRAGRLQFILTILLTIFVSVGVAVAVFNGWLPADLLRV